MKKFFPRLFEKDLDLVSRNDPGNHPGAECGMDNLVALGKAGFHCFPAEGVLKSYSSPGRFLVGNLLGAPTDLLE